MAPLRHRAIKMLLHLIRPEYLIVYVGAFLTGLVVMLGSANFGMQQAASEATVYEAEVPGISRDQRSLLLSGSVVAAKFEIGAGSGNGREFQDRFGGVAVRGEKADWPDSTFDTQKGSW